MKETNRKSIAILIKLPQFTTMNVIDGQVVKIIYTSLIFYSLTIDNILNIIVLLILAGVAISMLSGDNGILKQAADAKTETEKVSAEEEVRLAVMAALSEGEGKVDITDTTGETKGSLKKALENEGIDYNSDGVISYKGKTYIVSKNGKVETKKFTADKYGELTDYKKDINGDGVYNDWQVFYDDGTNVYLIAKDYVELDDATKTATGIATNGYYAWWNSAPDLGEDSFGKNCVKAFTTKSNWESFLDNTTAEYVIGGPTIELFVKSFNEKYTNKTIEYIYEGDNIDGIKWSTGDPVLGNGYLNYITFDANVKMYGTAVSNECNGYWLGSVGYGNKGMVRAGNVLSCIDYCDDKSEDMYGVRPMVCLKSDAQFEKVDGVWNIK